MDYKFVKYGPYGKGHIWVVTCRGFYFIIKKVTVGITIKKTYWNIYVRNSIGQMDCFKLKLKSLEAAFRLIKSNTY